MSNLSRTIIISFAIILLYTGISRDYYNGLLNSNCKNADTEHALLYASENINSLYYLHRPGENLVNFANNLLFSNLKNFSNVADGNSYTFELRIINSIHRYYTYSKIIHLSLPIQLIIFPFHFFG